MSTCGVRNDIDDTIVLAGSLLSQLHDVISKVPTGALPDSRHQMEPSLPAELSVILAACKAHTSKESSVVSASEKIEEGGEEEGLEQAKGAMV